MISSRVRIAQLEQSSIVGSSSHRVIENDYFLDEKENLSCSFMNSGLYKIALFATSKKLICAANKIKT